MRILVATDAWKPQTNGVVRTLEQVANEAGALGAEIQFFTPEGFRSIPLPGYPEVRLALVHQGRVDQAIEARKPDYLHIATEGPIGLAARRWARLRGRHFTTSYHTRFPEYLRQRLPIPMRLTYALLRGFHNSGRGVMVATDSLADELRGRGFERLLPWCRGVDSEMFRPRPSARLDLPGPIFIYVGRVALEKNLEAFLSLDLPGSKVIVGEGPALAGLRRRFPAAHFLGLLTGEALAEAYSAADVFVFPSLTDTYGIVLLEALASGVPVAAFPVTGPRDVLEGTGVGVLDQDLRKAALAALEIPKARAREVALRHSWRACAESFIRNIQFAAPLAAGRFRAAG